MIGRLRSFVPSNGVLVQALIVLATLFGAVLVGRAHFAPRDVLIALIACSLLILILSVRSVELASRYIFLLWIATLATGWRGLWVTSNLRFYAGEVIIWGLLIVYISLCMLQARPIRLNVPRPVLLLTVGFGLISILNAYNSARVPWDVSWAEYKDFLMAIPVFVVSAWMITTRQQWQQATTVYIATMVVIAILGVIEFATGISLNFFGSTDVAIYSDTTQGFTRALFTFWGHPSVIVIIVPAAALLLGHIANWRPQVAGRFPFVLAGALGIIAGSIYVAGHRGGWIALAACILVFVLTDLRHRWSLLIVMSVGLLFLPASFYDNLKPLLFGTDQFYDSSVNKRVGYLEETFAQIQYSPVIGIGWGAAGWVHNEFAQFSANVGLPAAALYILWLASLGWRLLRLSWGRTANPDPTVRNEATALLGALAGLVILMNSEVIMSLAPLAIGFWCFLALIERYLALHQVVALTPFAALPTSALSADVG